MKMHKLSSILLPMLFVAGAAVAQAPESTLRESTDPAKIAEIERRVEALRRGQTSSTSPGMQRDMPGGHAHGEMHRGAKGHHHANKRGHHRGQHGMGHDHPKAVPGSGGAAK